MTEILNTTNLKKSGNQLHSIVQVTTGVDCLLHMRRQRTRNIIVSRGRHGRCGNEGVLRHCVIVPGSPQRWRARTVSSHHATREQTERVWHETSMVSLPLNSWVRLDREAGLSVSATWSVSVGQCGQCTYHVPMPPFLAESSRVMLQVHPSYTHNHWLYGSTILIMKKHISTNCIFPSYLEALDGNMTTLCVVFHYIIS